MERLKFNGAWTALVTPFTKSGEVDWKGLEASIEFQISQGITGVVPTGTTGESPTLSWDEHARVIDRVVDIARGRCKVIAGTGSNSTQEAIDGTRHALNAGANGALLVDCYYNGPSSLELRKEYYGAVAEAVNDIMLVPYIIPGRTGTAMAPEDLAILASLYPNIRAVKEATGDIERMKRTRELVGGDFDILSGDDDITFDIMMNKKIRASGVISVISNVLPAFVEKMARGILSGDEYEAKKLHNALQPLFKIVTVKSRNNREITGKGQFCVEDKFRNPLPIKVLMNGLGMAAGHCRRPLGKMSENGVEIVRGAVRTVWENNPELLKPIEKAYNVRVEERIRNDKYWEELVYTS